MLYIVGRDKILHSLRVSAKIVIGFLFTIIVILYFLTVSLFGVKAEDTVRIVVTEATGLHRNMVVFYADLQPMVIHNVFWLCLASFGFMLIFLYFIDHSFKGFLAPGILSLAMTIFLAVIIAALHDHIFKFTGSVSELYIKSALERFRIGAYGMAGFGVVLIAVSQWGDQLINKIKK
jgi:hypothetical protein